MFKKEMNWKWIFEKGMFWVLVLVFFIINYFTSFEVRGVNKTVGWTFDRSNQWVINGFLVFVSWLVFITGYGVITLLRKKTNLNLSIAHSITFVMTLIAGTLRDLYGIEVLVVNSISIFVFILNVYSTFKGKF